MKSEMQITNHERRATSGECVGSALILTVVLTSLLAIVGVLFVMISRVDKMATSSISEYKELNFAVESVVAKISEELALDVPGMPEQEYYDYPIHNIHPGPDGQLYTFDDLVIDPGQNLKLGDDDDPGIFYYTVKDNIWLADLEPRLVDVTRAPARDPIEDIDIERYGFSHISDVYGRLGYMFQDSYDFVNGELSYSDSDGDRISFRNLRATIIEPFEPIKREGDKADADGDGVSDSRWVLIPDLYTSKGKPIYAAIRIIDNGGMLNVNTAYKFTHTKADPETNPDLINGSKQWHVNLEDLGRGGDLIDSIDIARGLILPENFTALDFENYERDVIWRLQGSSNTYLPFDISDELILRNRYFIDQNDTITRLKSIWPGTFDRQGAYGKNIPYQRGDNLSAWFGKAADGGSSYYIPRHIATTYNMDRIIDPNGRKMLNVNTAGKNELYNMILERIYDKDPYSVDAEQKAAQLAVNIVDRLDDDTGVTVLVLPGSQKIYYGFESQPFISEIAFRISGTEPNNPENNYFAIELYNPFEEEIPLNGLSLELRSSSGTIEVKLDSDKVVVEPGKLLGKSRVVIRNKEGETDLILAKYIQTDTDPPTYELSARYDVYLIRSTQEGDIYLDKQETKDEWFDWDVIKEVGQFYSRPDNNWNIVYQQMQKAPDGTLGAANGGGGRHNYNIPTFRRFVTVGDIARILTIGPSTDPDDMIGERLEKEPDEELIRLNLQNPAFANIFQYLTAIDPTEHIDPPDRRNYANDQEYNAAYELFLNETRIKGRININTAPWFVIAQLPWITHPAPVDPANSEYMNRYKLAEAIVAYRDKKGKVISYEDQDNWDLIIYYDELKRIRPGSERAAVTQILVGLREDLGFDSIGELATVVTPDYPEFSMAYYMNGEDEKGFPDLTTDVDPTSGVDVGDGASDDFEERDLIFSRISNLVTVRSDVFTAYILVRIGADGPQKRVLVILDRSDVTSTGGKVRILALHPVPDPR